MLHTFAGRLAGSPRALLLAALVSVSPAAVAAQAAPANGADVLQRMHDAYTGTWYTTLRFVQKTTQYRPNGSVVISTWYESLRQTPSGTQLRIDAGDPKLGNGTLYTADSTWSFRGGKLVAAVAGGNEFLPVIEGVYLQPISRTTAELAGTNIDMSRVASGEWEGRPVWIIGASSAGDSTAPQLWIDKERNVAVRMMLSPAPRVPMLDIHLGDYVKVGDGWLATKVLMLRQGKPLQEEDYADWKVAIPLGDALFSTSRWVPENHWAYR
jgi:hypothetical protein